MNRFFIVFVLLLFSLAYAQENLDNISENQQEGEVFVEDEGKDKDKDKEEDNDIEKNDTKTTEGLEDKEKKELSAVDQFFRHPGFSLFPRTPTFSVRNLLRNEFYYDSNIFLEEDDDEGDFVYSIDYSIEIEKKFRRLNLGLLGGIRYNFYFEEEDLREFLPRGEINANYTSRDEKIYIKLYDRIERFSTFNNVELNDRSPWYRNFLEVVVGGRPLDLARVEVSFDHTYEDFDEIEGDRQTYNANVFVGFNTLRTFVGKWDIFLRYNYNFIDYREAFFIIEEGRDQNDTAAHSVTIGTNVNFVGNLTAGRIDGGENKSGLKITGRAHGGIEWRNDDEFFYFLAGVTWVIRERLTLDVDVQSRTVASFFGDFQHFTEVIGVLSYMFRENFVGRVQASYSYSNPDEGDISEGIFVGTTFTYRIRNGIEVEAFHRYFYRHSEDDVNGDDYHRHHLGVSLRIIW